MEFLLLDMLVAIEFFVCGVICYLKVCNICEYVLGVLGEYLFIVL